MNNEATTSAKVRVFGFSEKTRLLINSGVLSSVTSIESFCRVTGITRANYFRICKEELPPLRGHKVSRVNITHKVLGSITKTFNIPSSYFTTEYTLSEFEHLLNLGPWKNLIALAHDKPESDFSALRGNQRIGPPKEEGPELGIYRISEHIAFEFKGKPDWSVLFLNHRPDGKVVSLLPNAFGSKYSITGRGTLRLPEEAFWVVQVDDPPGTHVFAAIFYHDKVSSQLFDESSYAPLLDPNSSIDDQRLSISMLFERLEKLKTKINQPFEVIAKEMYIAAG